MDYFYGLVFVKTGYDMDELIKSNVMKEGMEIDDEKMVLIDKGRWMDETGYIWEPLCDGYQPADILLAKDGTATCTTRVADVDWDKTLKALEGVPEDEYQLECIVEDEGFWMTPRNLWEGDTFTEYIQSYVAKLLGEIDADAMVYALLIHRYECKIDGAGLHNLTDPKEIKAKLDKIYSIIRKNFYAGNKKDHTE